MSGSDSLLPVVPSPGSAVSPKRRPVFDWKNRLAVALRILMLLLIVASIRSREASELADLPDRHDVSIEQARLLSAEANYVGPLAAGGQEVEGADGKVLGRAISTIPEANGVVGYRGASHCVMLVDDLGEVMQVALLKSRDTVEHVELVQNSKSFWGQFSGWKMGAPKSLPDVDGVSGATLTSLAIAEGIALRMGQQPGSLKFPDPITQKEISIAWPELAAGVSIETHHSHVFVHDEQGSKLGTLIRTGVLVDSIAGYQGPTELLIQLDPDDQIQNISKRGTWDNEPYVSYLDDEPWFWDPFLGSRFGSVAAADLRELGVEGVSGATMTSMAAADTLIAAAKQWNRRERQQQQTRDRKRIHWTANDIGSVAVVLVGCLMAFTRLRSSKKLGFFWNVLLVAYFGLITGNLVSLVVIFGWSASGIAYQLAPGFALVVAASFLLPALTKRNVYCSHLCPHGAAQQLLRNRVPRRFRLPKSLMRWLTWVPGSLLVCATVCVLAASTLDLAAIEPFNAYIWYVSGTSSIVLAVASLMWATFEPMAWCRYGCASGRLLGYVRLSAASTRPALADAIVLGLAGLSFLMA